MMVAGLLVKHEQIQICGAFEELWRCICLPQRKIHWRTQWWLCFFASNAEDSWRKNQCRWICSRAVGRGADSRYTERGIKCVECYILSFLCAFLMPKFLSYVCCPCFLPALPCDIILWCTHFLFIRACSSSLFRHKGTPRYFLALYFNTCFLYFL